MSTETNSFLKNNSIGSIYLIHLAQLLPANSMPTHHHHHHRLCLRRAMSLPLTLASTGATGTGCAVLVASFDLRGNLFSGWRLDNISLACRRHRRLCRVMSSTAVEMRKTNKQVVGAVSGRLANYGELAN